MVVGTSRIALIHARLARMASDHLPIATCDIPFDFATMHEVVQHHRARTPDPALLWLQTQRIDIAASA